MLIFEPNHYTKLSPKDGDEVLNYYYNNLVGEVLEVYDNGNIQIINIDGPEWVYEKTDASDYTNYIIFLRQWETVLLLRKRKSP